MNPWIYQINSYKKQDNHHLETLFTQMNGYLGVRGYPEEGIPGYEGIPEAGTEAIGSSPQQFVAGYFDASPVTRNTMVNLPTLRLTRIFLDGEKFDLSTGVTLKYKRSLDISNAVTRRQCLWTSPRGCQTELSFVSFLSHACKHILLTEITITPVNWGGQVVIEEVFDATGLTLGQRHFDIAEHGELNSGLFCKIKTRTSGLDALMASAWNSIGTPRLDFEPATRRDWTVARRFSYQASTWQKSRLHRYLAVCTDFDRDASGDIHDRTFRLLSLSVKSGWRKLLAEQSATWKALWKRSDIAILGDPERNFKLRYSIFLLLQAYRPGDSRLSIGAKFLSGDHYSGHYFWDTDNFLFPFYLLTLPEYARNMVEYRVNNLPGAQVKAKDKKAKGAFYPWEACPFDGRENCPEWWKDKAAKEPVYIPCGDIELHINTSVAMALSHFLRVAPSKTPSAFSIHQVLVEIARYWASRGVWENGRFHIKNVIGPDEYHEYVDDNAYTNHTARWAIQQALSKAGTPAAAKKHGVSKKEIADWRDIIAGMETGYDAQRDLLAQDATFLSLEDTGLACFKPVVPLFRQITPEEIAKIQVLKQADVLALFHALPFDYDLGLMQRCWDYYEPRTIHDSNLSAGTHAIVAPLLGRREAALKYLDRVLDLDIGNASYNVNEGFHAANAGNAWGAVIFGAAGIRWTEKALCCTPQLHDKWTSLRFPLVYKGRQLLWTITRKLITVACEKGKSFEMIVAGRQVLVPSKSTTLQLSTAPMGILFDLEGVLVDTSREEILLPGVKPLLSRLRLAGIKLAVASNSGNAAALLRQAGLDQYYFDAVAVATDLPYTQVLLQAAKNIGSEPARCLAVLRTQAATTAAREAKIQTLRLGATAGKADKWHSTSLATAKPQQFFEWLAQIEKKNKTLPARHS